MRKSGLEPHMSSKWLMYKGFYKGQVSHLSFMAPGFVR
jgi:hypothetical protein